MKLTHLTDEQLLVSMKRFDQQEKQSLIGILFHLIEMDRRRIYSAHKKASLHDFAVETYGWAEDEACRRIAAMTLLRELPEIEKHISDGKLNVTTLNIARTHFRREAKAGRKYSKTDKVEFVAKIVGQSKRKAEQIVAEISPSVAKPDKITPISQPQSQFNFVGENELRDIAAKLRGLVAHTHPDVSFGDLCKIAFGAAIEKLDKSSAPARKSHSKDGPISKAAIRAFVFARDKICVICGSDHALEPDHITPEAKGGDYSIENLRLLCRHCNQWAAIQEFGQEKMDEHLRTW